MRTFLLTGIDPARALPYSAGYGYEVTNTAPAVNPPAIVDLPSIGGTPEVGQVLTRGNAIWAGATPMTLETIWQVSALPPPYNWQTLTDQTDTLTLTSDDLGHYVRVGQRATNVGGPSEWVFSAPTGPVLADNNVEPVVYPRMATGDNERLLFAGHSGVQTGNGAPTFDTPAGHGGILHTAWPGGTLIDFVPFGTMRQVWDQNGAARTGTYDVMITSEGTTDLENGFGPLDQAAATMQALFWLGETAHAKGAEAVLMAMWAPRDAQNLFGPGIVYFEGMRQWYEAETGRDLWIIPAAQFIRDAIAGGATPAQVYADFIHLTPAYARAISYLEYSFLTHRRCPYVVEGDEALDELAWQTLLTYECAGMGGTVTTTVPAYTNPLPDPLPVPGIAPLETDFALNTTPGYLGALNLSNVSENSMNAQATNTTRRVVTWPISWPEGTVIEFDVTNSHTLYVRLDDDQELQNPGTIEVGAAGGIPAGSNTHVSYTLNATGATKTHFGFLLVTGGATFAISNFRVTLPEVEQPAAFPPVTSRVLMSGHSLVDAIESGDGDTRQTWRTLRPSSLPIGAWRRNTIPGSNMQIRWGNRFGYNYDGEQPPEPYPPFDVNNPESTLISARDMHEFDVFLITEAGPFALPLNPDRYNALWNDSKRYLDLWHGLAMAEGIAPENFFFWTIWPAFNLEKSPEDDPDLPNYLAVCKRYNRTAEEWCRDKGIRIIPGHRIAAEIYTRIMDGRLPAHDDDGRTWYRFSWLFDTAEDDLIHPSYLGSIFFAVGCYRHMFGVMPTDAQIQAMLDAGDAGHPYTLAHVKDTITATLDYVQGEGIDLQVGTFVPPTPFLNFAQPLAAQGATMVGAGVVANTPVGPNNGAWKALPEAPVNQYALYEVSFTDNERLTPVGLAQAPQGATWDAKFFGLVLDGEGANYNMKVIDGGRFLQMIIPKPWTGDQHMIVEVNSGPLGSRIRALTDPSQWLPEWNERGSYWATPDRFGVNLLWDSNNMLIGGGDFTIHKGLVYFDYPDAVTRLRLIASFMDGIVP